MGSQSRRFRASQTMDSELVYLYLVLFLCLGFLSRPADYGHTHQRDYRGAFEFGTANPGAILMEHMTSEVIALVNSASNYVGFIGKYFSASDFGVEWRRKFFVLKLSVESNDHSLDRFKLDSSGDGLFCIWPEDTHFLYVGSSKISYLLLPEEGFNETVVPSSTSPKWSGQNTPHPNPRPDRTTDRESHPGSLPSPIFDAGYMPDNDLELRAKVISITFVGIISLVILLRMAWKRKRAGILCKPDPLIFESDLDESHLDDQTLYDNLLKEAVLVSEGSSGKVFKVRFLEVECAMKVFHSNARMDFRKESITLLNLSHPHVVKIFCCFRKPFIIMELMDEDLYSFITKIRERHIDYNMPLEVALDVMLQIAKGMSYLHNQGIAHQDLKSLNILLKLRGEFDDPDFEIIAKVADFGSTRHFDPRYPKGFVLFPNMNIGTRLWRAPELFHPRGCFLTQFLGLSPSVLPKPLDIYGFAVICSELLTKQVPFSYDKDLRVSILASKIREGHRPALPSLGCPKGLLTLIKDCWHQDPILRPEFHEVCVRLMEVKSSWMSSGQSFES